MTERLILSMTEQPTAPENTLGESIPGCYQNYGKPTAPNNYKKCDVAEDCKKSSYRLEMLLK